MRRIIGPLLALLTLTGAYLYGFPAPTLVYGAAVIAHVVGGLAAAVLLVLLARAVGTQSWPARVGWAVVLLGAAAGLAIVKTGGTLPYRPLVLVHIAASVAGIVILSAERLARMGRPISPSIDRSDRPSAANGNHVGRASAWDDCWRHWPPSPSSPLPWGTARGTCGKCGGTSPTGFRTPRCRPRR